MPLSDYCITIDHPESRDQVILFSTRTAACVVVRRGVLHDIECGVLPKEERDLLFDLGLFVPNRVEEHQEMLDYVDQMNADESKLHLTVVMNLDCNLACAYCFEGTRKGRHFLSQETADDLLRALDAIIGRKKELRISFYGGEPLLSFKMIEQISRRIRVWADSKNISFSFSLVTNSTLLTREVVDRLTPHGLRSVSPTLDGPRKIHDRSRPFKNGSGSFDIIIRNLQSVCEAVDVNLGGNYTRENFRQFPEMLDALIECGLGPEHIASMSFSPVFNEESRFVLDFHEGCCNMNESWIAEAGLFLRQEILSRGFHTAQLEPTVCMIERQDHLIVNWDGGLYKCTGLIDRPEYQVGTLRTGFVDYSHSHDLGNWKNETCLSCSYLPLCFGGCRYFKLLRQGTVQGIECKKPFFDRALPDLVLQDMARAAVVK